MSKNLTDTEVSGVQEATRALGRYYYTMFCPDFQKGRVPSEKSTFSAVNEPSQRHNQHGKLKKKGTISVVNGRKGHY